METLRSLQRNWANRNTNYPRNETETKKRFQHLKKQFFNHASYFRSQLAHLSNYQIVSCNNYPMLHMIKLPIGVSIVLYITSIE